MSKKLPVNNFASVEDTFQIIVIKSCNEESNEVYFLEVDVQYPGKLHEFHNDLPFFTRKNEN